MVNRSRLSEWTGQRLVTDCRYLHSVIKRKQVLLFVAVCKGVEMKQLLVVLIAVLLPLTGFATGAESGGEEILWIDVRTAEEYSAGHLPGAININYTEITVFIGDHAESKERPIKLYCGTGRRAGIAKQALEEAGYRNVSNEGGLGDVMAKQEQQQQQ